MILQSIAMQRWSGAHAQVHLWRYAAERPSASAQQAPLEGRNTLGTAPSAQPHGFQTWAPTDPAAPYPEGARRARGVGVAVERWRGQRGARAHDVAR